jgi:hypothetical protein
MKLGLMTGAFLAWMICGAAACSDDTSSDGPSSGGGGHGASGGGGHGGSEGGAGGGDGGGGQSAGGNGGAGGAATTPTVALEITPTSAAPGAMVQGTVTVTNFILEAPVGQPDQDGHGHYHVYLDDAVGGDYLVNGQTPGVSIPIPAGATPGMHTLRISLSDNHHVPFTPEVEHVIDLTVE